MGKNIYINNYVLTEVVALFFVLTMQVFNSVQEPPEGIATHFGFMRENGEAANYELSDRPVQRVLGSFEGRKVPAENKIFRVDFELKDAIPEVEALRLLKEIYHWFGITDEEIPYVDSAETPERVDRTRYA